MRRYLDWSYRATRLQLDSADIGIVGVLTAWMVGNASGHVVILSIHFQIIPSLQELHSLSRGESQDASCAATLWVKLEEVEYALASSGDLYCR